MTGRLGVVFGLLIFWPFDTTAFAAGHPKPDPPPPAYWLEVRTDGPGTQLERLLALFQGTKAPHPAAALTYWREATRGRGGPGKAAEAAIAALNPAMVRELKPLDGAVVRFNTDPETRQTQWYANVFHDDGALAAAATALALTDGAPQEPIAGAEVVRTGPEGSWLIANRPGRLVVAPGRETLAAGLNASPDDPTPAEELTGLVARLDPDGLRTSGASLSARRVGEALAGLTVTSAVGRLSFEGDDLCLDVKSLRGPRGVPRPGPGIQPGWLDPLATGRLLGAATASLDGGAAEVDDWFRLLDRVEKADPSRAQVAPLRVRLNLIAAAARVRPEADLWPNLRGISLVVLDDSKRGLVGLHTADPASATRLADETVVRLTSAFLKARPGDPTADGSRTLGTIGGRPITLVTRRESLWIGWGDRALADGLAGPDAPASNLARDYFGAATPRRVGLVWPDRLARSLKFNDSLVKALVGAPPVTWVGRDEGHDARDVVKAGGLHEVVRRGLDALPLKPPTDRATSPRN